MNTEATPLGKFNGYLKTCADLHNERLRIEREYRHTVEEKNKFMYEWVKKKHPSWLKHAVVEMKGERANFIEDFSSGVYDNSNEIWVSILTYDPKAAKLANQGYEIEDTYWRTHTIKPEDLI